MRQTILDHVTFGLFTAALPDILGSVECSMLRATNSPPLRDALRSRGVTIDKIGQVPGGEPSL
jgi:hypothetical protein